MRAKRLITGGLLLAVVAVVVLQAASYLFSPLQPNSKDSMVIEIHKGQSPKEITHLLHTLGVISPGGDESRFFWMGRLTSQWRKIKAGEYKLSPAMSPLEIFSVLTSGVSIVHPVTVIEGENIFEIAEDLAEQKLSTGDHFLSLCKNSKLIASLGFDPAVVTSLEGFLFPNTYHFNKTQTTEEIIRQMVRQFRAVWGPNEDKRAQELGFTQFQLVTLASMIEKETGAPQERPMISSIFHNRLKKKMKLQSDPTTIYGIWNRYDGNIHKADLLESTPYNTYTVPALPAGPIANPGKEAIQAALYPSQSDYLYFVSHNDGTHQFSRTLEEHNAAVHKFQINPGARKGKSWRDLRKGATPQHG